MAHYEPPRQDLCCLQIQLFSSLVIKELILKVPKLKIFELENSVKFTNNIDLDEILQILLT